MEDKMTNNVIEIQQENNNQLKRRPFNPFVVSGIVLIILVLIIYAFNYFQLQSNMDNVLKNDPRNNDIKVSVHYGYYINSSILIYDLKTISGDKSAADVFRVFLQFADSVKDKKIDSIELTYKGVPKFILPGEYFQTIGKEYSSQNPIYTIRTFPEKLLKTNGTKAYSQWSGGFIGVLTKQMNDFNDFNKKWYLE
jgi:hypothetical protein